MTHISVLPKELQNLLDHYVNFDNWLCLSEIFAKISSLTYYVYSPKIKDHMKRNIEKLFQNLPKTNSTELRILESMPGSFQIYITIKLSYETLITKDILLETSKHVCNLLNNDMQSIQPRINDEIQSIQGLINDCLRKYKHKERCVTIAYAGDRNENKIVQI